MSSSRFGFTDRYRDLQDRVPETFQEHTGKILALMLVVLAVGMVFSGTGTDGDIGEGEFNQADIIFMSMMTVHHEQAIEMAEMAPERTNDENVLQLSENISETNQQELDQMKSWLEEAGFGHLGNSQDMEMGGIIGIASEEKIQELRQRQDNDFNQLYSELIIEHHEGGIQMAEMALQNGQSEKVADLAQSIKETQQREIDRIRPWQEEWDEEIEVNDIEEEEE